MSPVDYSPPANPTLVPPAHAVVQSQQTRKDPRPWREYTVRPGDSLTKIAVDHDTTIAALVAKNKLTDPQHVVTGKTIKVPGPAPKRSTAPATKKKTDDRRTWAKAKSPARWSHTHTVAPGENAMWIAAKYSTSWRAVLKANKISDARSIKSGQKLRVPTKTPPKDSTPDAEPKQQAPAEEKQSKAKQAPAEPKKESSGKRTEKKTSKDASEANDENTFLGRTYPDEVVAAAAKNRHTLSHRDVPSRTQTRTLIVKTAQRYGVDPRLALAVAWQESGWNQRAVSVANAVGVMQVMPGTGQWCGSMIGRRLDLLDPEDNVTAGVVFLRWLTEHAGSSDEAIAGYYQGLGSVEKNGMYPDTKTYVANVKAHMKRF